MLKASSVSSHLYSALNNFFYSLCKLYESSSYEGHSFLTLRMYNIMILHNVSGGARVLGGLLVEHVHAHAFTNILFSDV